jgi:hypothetical protein
LEGKSEKLTVWSVFPEAVTHLENGEKSSISMNLSQSKPNKRPPVTVTAMSQQIDIPLAE